MEINYEFHLTVTYVLFTVVIHTYSTTVLEKLMYSTTARRCGFIIVFQIYKVERRMRDLTTTDMTRHAVHNIILYTCAKRKRI